METRDLKNDPAFPTPDYIMENSGKIDFNPMGMSKRFYAAIALKVPGSGEEWLDEMIRKANRRDAACAIMSGLLANPEIIKAMAREAKTANKDLAKAAYETADELLKQENE